MRARDRLKQAFNRAASSGATSHILAREVSGRLIEQLDWLKIAPECILDAGCGMGLDAPSLRARYPDASYTGIDVASVALRVASEKVDQPGIWGRLWAKFSQGMSSGNPGANWVCADFEQLPFAVSSFDLVWSNLALHWASDTETAFRRLRAAMRPEGLLLFSCYGPDTLKELRTAFAKADGRQHINRFMDMHDIGDMLMRTGFSSPIMSMECITLTYLDVLDVLNDIKRSGENSLIVERHAGLMGRGAWQRMVECYEELRSEGRLPATYEIVYGHAWAAAQPAVARSGGGYPVRWIRSGATGAQ